MNLLAEHLYIFYSLLVIKVGMNRNNAFIKT